MNKTLKNSAYACAALMVLGATIGIIQDKDNLTMGLIYIGIAVIFSALIYKEK